MAPARSSRGRVRRLTGHELNAYDVAPPELTARVRIVRLPKVPGPFAGITIGNAVFVMADVPSDGSSMLLAHELVHVRQWAELGAFGFLTNYLRDFAKALIKQRRWFAAYREIEAEQEARAIAELWRQRRAGSSDR